MKAPELLQREVQRFADHLAPATNDRDLLALFVATRDEHAFAELVRRHGPMVLSTCRRILRNLADADDAFQAVFVVLLRRAATLHDPERLGPWLYRVAWRIASKLRAKRRLVPLPDDVPAPPANDWLDVFDDLLAALPEKFRTPLVLCYLQGHTVAETAHRLHVPPATVATWLHRGREHLRQRLTKRGVVLPTAFLAVVGTGVPDVLAERVAGFVRSSVIPSTITRLAHSFAERTLMRFMYLTGTCVLVLAGGVGFFGFHADGQEPTSPPAKDAPKAPPTDGPTPGVVDSANFHVQAKTTRLAALLAEQAERVRKEEAIKWFGKEQPRWAKPVVIKYDAAAIDNSGMTIYDFPSPLTHIEGMMAERNGSIGHTFTARMLLAGDLEVLLTDSLNREVVHCLLAGHFGAALPRWADEGIALQSESAESRTKYRDAASDTAKGIEHFTLEQLLTANEYPKNAALFRAQCFALGEWLVQRKDRATLVQFVTDGMASGWASAAKKHYGFATLDEMQRMIPVAAERKTMPPAAPRPNAVGLALASFEKETLTIVRQASTLTPDVKYEERTTVVGLDENKQPKVVKYYEPVQTARHATYYLPEKYPTTAFHAHDAAGNKLTPADIAKLLAKPTGVVVVQGATLEPEFKKLLQPQAIIVFILKPLPTPAGPAKPPSGR